jgi:histidinol-phosphatase (PHP family)
MSNSKKTLHEGKTVNLHTHSRYCGHGSGELSDFVEAAKRSKFTALGLSEHCPVPDERWNSSRMDYNQIQTYMDECRTLQRDESDIEILCGFECDHDARYTSWYKEELLDTHFADYLVFAIHYMGGADHGDLYLQKISSDKKNLHEYTDRYVDGLLSGMYLFGVHPDIFGMFYRSWDDEAISCSKSILACAESQQIPLEINGYGFRKPIITSTEGRRLQYPLRQFWELATQYDIQVIVNSDTHYPEDMDLEGLGAHELAQDLNLTYTDWIISDNTFGGKTIEKQK